MKEELAPADYLLRNGRDEAASTVLVEAKPAAMTTGDRPHAIPLALTLIFRHLTGGTRLK